MTELLTYVRRRARGALVGKAGYGALPTEEEDKENASPSAIGKKVAARSKDASDDAGGDRRSSWLGRVLSYSSGAFTNHQTKSKRVPKKKGKGKGGGYSRRAMPSTAAEKKERAYQQYLQDMKSYFSDVDAYELVEESPEPTESAKEAVLDANIGGDCSYSHRRQSKSNRRSSIVVRRESGVRVGGNGGGRLSRGPSMRLSTKFETVAKDEEDLGTIAEEATDGGDDDGGLVEALDDVMGGLTLDGETEETAAVADEDVTDLDRLLRECGQPAAGSGGAVRTLDDFLVEVSAGLESADGRIEVRKVGEGTFGEAFKLNNDLVLKVVPIDGDMLVNGEKQKTSGELLAEVVIHNCLRGLRGREGQNLCGAFIETHGISVCSGAYATCLLEAWEDWDAVHKSENDHVGAFQEGQLYIVFVYSDGGEDLESFRFRNFDEVRSMLLQVTLGLAVAEEELEFEHRDLHWGNILLKRTARSADDEGESNNKSKFVLRGVPLEVDTSGVRAHIIDFTLSRLEAKTGEGGDFVAFCDLSQDEWLFKGPKGDIQAETYRKMAAAVEQREGGSWSDFYPRNNVFWLQYLVDCVLSNKARQAGSSADETAVDAVELTSDECRRLRHFRKACLSQRDAKCCHDLVWHDLFRDCWKVTK